MKEIKIQDIDFTLRYDGYYWYSNTSKPEIIRNQIIPDNILTALPFIIEGNFYSEDSGISINIKNIDGQYKIYECSTFGLIEDHITRSELLAHDLKGVEKIKVVQYWEESDEDPLLENMKTLQPVWQAFVGFINN